LILKKDDGMGFYQRIGTAYFLRTEKQRSLAPLSKPFTKSTLQQNTKPAHLTEIYIQGRPDLKIDDLEGLKFSSPEVSAGPVTSHDARVDVTLV
jgi:hypothetical protein